MNKKTQVKSKTNTKTKKICNCGCPKSLRLKAKLRKQQQKLRNSQKKSKTQKTVRKTHKFSNKKTTKRVQRGGSNCDLGLGTERAFTVEGESGLNGLNVPASKFLLTPKPGCMSSNHAGL